jgi:transposase
MKDELLENNVVSLHTRGWSMRRLSREFGISRQRVKRILDRNTQHRNQGNEQLVKPKHRASKLDPYKSDISEWLEKYKNPPITNQRIYELLEEKGYAGKKTILGDYLSRIRGKRSKEPIVCVETIPGQRASHDWSEYNIDFTDPEGGSEKVIFFSYILNYSRRQYLEVVPDKNQSTLLRCLINAFVYFEGVPKEIKSDNQKACVDRWELGRPVFNKKYLSFATHYRFRPLTIHPGKPRENLKVERPFYYLETNFLNGRTFNHRQDLKEQLSRWLLERNDQRIHRTTRRKPIDLYAEELICLQALPVKQYDTSTIAYRIVNNTSSIQWEGYYYVVPNQYMYETLAVRVNESQIIIYSPDYHPVATYPLAEKSRKNRYVGRKERSKKYTLPANQVQERLGAFGPVMNSYLEQMKKQKPKAYLKHCRHILSLKVNYRIEDIISAVKRAAQYRVYTSKAIENYLIVNADKKSELTF